MKCNKIKANMYIYNPFRHRAACCKLKLFGATNIYNVYQICPLIGFLFVFVSNKA
jgi:hypothetical protein